MISDRISWLLCFSIGLSPYIVTSRCCIYFVKASRICCKILSTNTVSSSFNSSRPRISKAYFEAIIDFAASCSRKTFAAVAKNGMHWTMLSWFVALIDWSKLFNFSSSSSTSCSCSSETKFLNYLIMTCDSASYFFNAFSPFRCSMVFWSSSNVL